MTVITDTDVLAQFCERLIGSSFVAVDTEFMRERTYWPILCLVQIAGPEEAAAIDPLAPGIDLTPLLALMADERTLKVFHAARQDVEQARAALPALFADFDALLVPAAPGEAPKGLERTGDPIFNRTWTMLHLPCVTIPARHGTAGLPVGVQLVGRPGDDARTLWAASFLERILEA